MCSTIRHAGTGTAQSWRRKNKAKQGDKRMVSEKGEERRKRHENGESINRVNRKCKEEKVL